MVGVVIGAVCAFVVMKMARRRFGFRRFGYGHGPWHHHGGGCGGYGGGGYGGEWGPSPGGGHGYRDGYDEDDAPPWASRRGRGWGGRGGFAMNAIFDRLDATPAQEKVIRSAIDELKTKARAVKSDVRGLRGNLATAMRGESLDAETLGTVASQASTALDALRDAAIGAMLKVHDVLDEKQRAIAADALDGHFRGFREWRRGR